MANKYGVLVADDQSFLRKGLISILERDPDFRVMGEAEDGLAVLDFLNQGIVPDVLILDLSMPRMSGIATIRQIRRLGYTLKILVLTMHKELDILCQVCSSDINGYMLKDEMARELLPALHALIQDKVYLTPLMSTSVPDYCWMKVTAQQNLPASTAKNCVKFMGDPGRKSAWDPL